jgi:glutamine synthetase
MVEAVETLVTPKSINLFGKFHIFTDAELKSRAEILYETYAKTINIEALTMIDMASKHIIPAVVKYTKFLAETVIAVREAGADSSVQSDTLTEVSTYLKEAKAALKVLIDAQAKAKAVKAGKEQAFEYRRSVTPAMDALRRPVDKLEMIVDKEMWPMPSYGDLIFEV